MAQRGRPRGSVAPQAVVDAVNKARGVDKAAEALGLSRQGVYLILAREGLQLVRQACSKCGAALPGKVAAPLPTEDQS